MSEPNPQEKANEVDLNNYVPKEEHEKVIKETEAKVAGLKKELDGTKLELLDPEYLEWRESKQGKQAVKAMRTVEKPGSADDRVAQLEAKIEDLSDSLNVTRQVAERLYFDRELELTRKDYPDFDDYREDVEKILTASRAPITYKQAYLMAKDAKARETKPDEKQDKKVPPASERPSNTIQAKALERKEFKTTDEANAATLAELKDKYPDLGDTI